MDADKRQWKTLQVIHVHGSSSAALTDFFTSSCPLAIPSIISDKCRLVHACVDQYKPPTKTVILRACDFFELFVFLRIQPAVFQAPQAPDKAVILRACDYFDFFVFSA